MSLYTEINPIESGFDYSISTPTVAPLAQPQDVKDSLLFPNTDLQDEIIARQIRGVVAKLERECGLTLETKTYTAYWQSIGWVLPLPFPPITSVTSVTLISPKDGSETSLTVLAGDFWLEGVKNKKIHFITSPIGFGVRVIYIAGITDSYDKDLAKEVIITECTDWFENRGNTTDKQLYKLSNDARHKIMAMKQ